MLLSADILAFLSEPVVLILATRGPGFTPEIGRGVGLFPVPGQDVVDIAISRWQWPATVSNLEENGQLAMTVSSPETYRTYQFKGPAVLRPCGSGEENAAAAYVDRMFAVFDTFQMPRTFAGHWLSLRDLTFARLTIAEVYVQTPGPQAGTRAGEAP